MKWGVAHLFAAALPVLALTLGAAGPAFGGPATNALQTWQAAIVGPAQQGAPNAGQSIRAILARGIDYQALAEASLVSDWAARSTAERAQFTDLLRQLVRKSLPGRLGQIAGYKVQYLSEVPMAGGGVMVNGASVPQTNPGAAPVQLGFAMHLGADGTWKVVDVVMDGTSFTASYGDQFGKVIKRHGFAGLLEKMRDKLAQP